MPKIAAQRQTAGPETADRSLGFTTMTEEIRVDNVDVEGSIPEWLSGRMIRATPAMLDFETATSTKSVGHWFDGLAMLNCFTFRDGGVSYASRFLESDAYKSVRDEKRLRQPMTFGTDPCRVLGRRLMSIFEHNDNANINIAKVGERYMALTEMPAPIEFDPETLQTFGPINFTPDVAGQLGPMGHPHGDETGAMICFFTHIGRESSYRLHIWEPGDTSRREMCRIPAKGTPRYMHSFAMTERYIVLMAQPLKLRMAKMVITGKMMEGLEWDPSEKTEFLVVDRRTERLVARYEAEPFFYFHQANAYDDGHDIVIDLVAMNDPSSIRSLELARLRDPDHKPRFYGELRRYRASMTTGKVTVETLSDAHLEFTQVNYKKVNGRPYQFVYGAACRTPDSPWFDQLVKIDVTGGEKRVWAEEGCFPSEPYFVQRPGEDGEDAGVVLSIVLDSRTSKSFLLVLDAVEFKELGRAHAPHHLGFNFHGGYFRG